MHLLLIEAPRRCWQQEAQQGVGQHTVVLVPGETDAGQILRSRACTHTIKCQTKEGRRRGEGGNTMTGVSS
jgi:hypothetical protein